MNTELLDFRAMMQDLASTQVAPYARDVDEQERFPEEAWQALCAADLPGLAHPTELGGSDGDLAAQAIAVEELSAACASTAMVLLVNWAGTCTVIHQGSDELKKLVVPDVSTGAVGAGWCLTEPTGGSDLSGIRTKAQRDGSDWVLNGQKRFISNADWGEWFAVLARSGEENEFGVFMVHKSDAGLSFGPPEKKMGLRGSPTADVILEDCRIPGERVVGDPTQGYKYIIDELNGSRALIAAQALGLAKGALRTAIEYTAERRQFGSALSTFQMVRAMVADAAIRVESASALLYKAVDAIENKDPRARSLVSMAKVLCSDNAMAVTTDAVQLLGGYGFTREYPVERMMRDAKVTQIYEGSNQIQRLVISKGLYKGEALS
ncbi:acyl-CoA dehydrogenase family protein [Mycolicibacterium smegmatis]|uniref:acyl-CoA dehydrogenase family protein n=1 Tax=Mycolicibacterium smegmatis TaxID=1772 RepID=UPI0005D88704|nr:acyl-CoA dehydrogenase family protein [Mycolicibacterium smegmatis]MDF1903611.1 acyl-CoA dehydrogenase family protein [Mycolicibacterium smegmatis]MDF1910137.1 acyl-CoA dehydrogenase family protein [Mycolicibacterium smegmatis]MDF1921988.1 acyl-CoA dehydrogenase family protein [Mycolicibacterium smegmatis]MDF1928646.1 acyl-CoA dehydrogenase family protein [Mycolicibacterium smegmatis]UAK55806.1 acyl-CoA dehydrogenase family protein [Mycolicibacterium smegmatis]